MRPYFTYGLPLGSALIVAAFMGIVLSWKSTLELADLIFDFTGGLGFQISLNFLLRILELGLHVGLLVFGVIAKGKSACLLAWIIFQGIFLFVWESEIVWSLLEYGTSLDFTSVLFYLYIILSELFQYAYPMYLAFNCLPRFESITDLEPVGKGFKQVFEFYVTNPWTCAGMTLMMEVVLNMYFLFVDHVAKFGFSFGFYGVHKSQSTADEIEEGVIRLSRLILCSIGFYLIQKESRKSIFTWCFSYFITLIFSSGILIYMMFAWRYSGAIRTFQYFTSFFVSLAYRVVVFIACLRYSGFFEVNGISLGTTA
ncbi:unnamed protein product [Orchesella dallaii]|uniref:Uncharacterized protein n=1 Tax=Orchesella dallaii TaxID=48710 RepID=A0ABP1QII9_9HEXA